jgi:hypothetical protein
MAFRCNFGFMNESARPRIDEFCMFPLVRRSRCAERRGCAPRLTEVRSQVSRAAVPPLFLASITRVCLGRYLDGSEPATKIVSNKMFRLKLTNRNAAAWICIVQNPSKGRVINKYPNRTINGRESCVSCRQTRLTVRVICCDHTLSSDGAEGCSGMC